MTHLFQEWWRSRREKKSASSAPPYASFFPTAVGLRDVGGEHCQFSFPLSMLHDDDSPAPPSGFIYPPQIFPIQRQQDDNVINTQYTPLEYKFFKDLKAAVAQYSPQSPCCGYAGIIGKRQINHSVRLGIYCPSCLGGFSMAATS